jgi:hypothetical protein
VYFFMEDGEERSHSGSGPRIVRVGTHALTEASRTQLWTRLSQHRGQEKAGGGNHRGSIFRLIVGTAIIARNSYDVGTWGIGNNAPANVRASELFIVVAHHRQQKIGVGPEAMTAALCAAVILFGDPRGLPAPSRSPPRGI